VYGRDPVSAGLLRSTRRDTKYSRVAEKEEFSETCVANYLPPSRISRYIVTALLALYFLHSSLCCGF
jgi:hypothetical protein